MMRDRCRQAPGDTASATTYASRLTESKPFQPAAAAKVRMNLTGRLLQLHLEWARPDAPNDQSRLGVNVTVR